MSRQALLVGDSAGADTPMEQILQRYGYTRISRIGTVAEALESIEQQHVELMFVPIDEVDELQLAAIDRAGRRERHMGVIATGPRSDPDLMLRAMRAGIQEFLVRPVVMTDLVAAVERLHRRTTTGVTAGQVYAVFSPKGGVGASTVAVNLAYALSANLKESRVGIADLALAGGDVRVLLNVKPQYDLGDLSAKVERIDADLLNSVMVPATAGLWVLAAPERPEAEDSVDANVVSAIVLQLRGSFNLSVLDCERDMSDRTLAALDAADRIVLLTELKVSAMRSAQRSLGIFRRLGYPNEKICVVVNRYQSSDVVSASEAVDVLKADLFFKIPNDYRLSLEAATAGVPVAKSHPESKLGSAYLQLAQKLAGSSVSDSPASGNGSRARLRHLFSRKRG
jgi:pilus assembly protein CpaE